MRKRVIPWALIILFAFILYFFSNESVTLALLLAVIVALPVSYAMLRLTQGKLEVSLEDAGAAAAGKNRFILRMSNTGFLPLAAAEMDVRCRNLRTGEMDSFPVSGGLMPRKSKEIGLDVTPVHAGRYEVSVSSARITDPLGIWSRTVNCEDTIGMTVLPELFDIQMISASGAIMPESDRQSEKTRGAVNGDMVGIREYVPGDPVRNIHWKLSEKNDKLLVKELGNPVTDQFLLILDSAVEVARDPAALDAIASVYASLIHTLRTSDFIVDASWTDPDTGEAVVRRIADGNDFRAAADEFLAVPAVMHGAYQMLVKGIADSRYVHVIFVGTSIPDNIENITNGCQATVLMYGGSSFSERNLTVTGFEAASYKTDTAGIEV